MLIDISMAWYNKDMDKTNDSREIIGRSAELIFTDFSDVPFPAKIDTGAYRSAIHASDIYLDENNVLHFRLFGNHPVCQEASFEASATEFNSVVVANSFGDKETRYEVKLRIRIGDQEFVTPFTLADRQKKIYPILLGRKALKKRYIIDIDKSGVDRITLKESFRINLPQDEEQDDDQED